MPKLFVACLLFTPAFASNGFGNAFFSSNFLERLHVDVVNSPGGAVGDTVENTFAPATVIIDQVFDNGFQVADIRASATGFITPTSAGGVFGVETFDVSTGSSWIPGRGVAVRHSYSASESLSVVSPGDNFSFFETHVRFTGVLAPGDTLFWRIANEVNKGVPVYSFVQSDTITTPGLFTISIDDVSNPYPNPYMFENQTNVFHKSATMVLALTKNGAGVSTIDSARVTTTGGTGTISPQTPGDYDNNGVVNETDYVIWRSTFGSNVSAQFGADGNGNMIVDAADYVLWRNQTATGVAHGLVLIPEPPTTILLATVFAVMFSVPLPSRSVYRRKKERKGDAATPVRHGVCACSF